MDQIDHSHKVKIVILVVLVVVALIVLGGLYFLFTAKNSQNSSGSSSTYNPPERSELSNSSAKTGFPVSSNAPTFSNNDKTWFPYKNEFYNILFPSSWQRNITDFKNGGGSLDISPSDPSDLNAFVINITVNSATQSAEVNSSFNPSIYGVARSKETINNIEYTKFTNSGENTTQQQVQFYTHRLGYDYVVAYSYPGAKNQEYENIFTAFISKLQIVK